MFAVIYHFDYLFQSNLCYHFGLQSYPLPISSSFELNLLFFDIMNSIFLSFQVHCQMWFFIACFLNELPKESFLYFTACCNKIIYLTLNKIIVWYFRAVLLLAWISLLTIIIHFWSYLFLVFLYYLQCFHFSIRCFNKVISSMLSRYYYIFILLSP
jgi:hypothetical protein